jgi:hypothetical protein
MKKLLTLAALAGLLGAQQCLAFTVNVPRTVGYYLNNGGEFTVTDGSDPTFNAIYMNYAPEARLGGGFQTFCINTSIGVEGGIPLNATLDPSGVAVGTSWLYGAFARGTLGSYNYADITGGGRATSAWELQNAIWELQGQTFDSTAASFYVGMAVSHFGTLANAMILAPGEVEALRMTTLAGIVSQPMLALGGATVPDVASTLILLGLGSTSLGAFRRFWK